MFLVMFLIRNGSSAIAVQRRANLGVWSPTCQSSFSGSCLGGVQIDQKECLLQHSMKSLDSLCFFPSPVFYLCSHLSAALHAGEGCSLSVDSEAARHSLQDVNILDSKQANVIFKVKSQLFWKEKANSFTYCAYRHQHLDSF